MKTRYGIAKGYRRDVHGEHVYYFIAECYIDDGDVVGCTPVAAMSDGFKSVRDLVRVLSTIVMDLMKSSQVVDTKKLQREGFVNVAGKL
jgi:hypothetical protein